MKQEEEDAARCEREFELSRQARVKTEGKCLLGFVVWTIVQQALTHIPGSSLPAVDKEQ